MKNILRKFILKMVESNDRYKLWLLSPRKDLPPRDKDKNPWWPPQDKAHGFVVRAKTESDARKIAVETTETYGSVCGFSEIDLYGYEGKTAWLSEEFSTCVELTGDGQSGVIMYDFRE